MRRLVAGLTISLVFLAIASAGSGTDTGDVVWTGNTDQSVSAGELGGATVSYTVTGTDPSNSADLPVTCVPSSPHLFPVGTTSVTCSTTDTAGPASTSFDITVTDNTAPTVTVPADIGPVSAAGPLTPVSFSASASDVVDGPLPVSCLPASPYPIGTTTVTCTATDHSNNTGHASFHITVHDDTPPQLTVPSDQSVAATSPSGAVVTYSAQATDNVDGAITPSCLPASGSTFPAKVTTKVTCTATDGAGNSASKSFNVTVNDSAPVLTHVNDIVAEANSPAGAAVTYTPPSATDIVDGGLAVTCLPASGATFHLGATTVNCSATNSSGQTGTTSFGVLVRDTTPPVLPIPGTLSLTSDPIVKVTNPLVVKYLSIKATDLVDPSPQVTSNAPAVFPFGKTTITFTAVDNAGNTSTATGTIEVIHPQGAASVPTAIVTPGTAPPDRTPPGNVRNLTISVSGRSARLRWRRPVGDFDHVAIFRSAGAKKAVAVYRGAALTFVDHRLTMGVVYRYLVVAVDHTGNQSTGEVAVARPTAQPLFGPASGQRVAAPVVLRWQPKGGATFYNVQLYRAKTKVLSAWPKNAKLVLRSRWSYGGKARQLLPGRYTWYVWPAHGTRKTPKYQPLEGFNSFVVVNT
jgi:hypothetical protein